MTASILLPQDVAEETALCIPVPTSADLNVVNDVLHDVAEGRYRGG